ncbi:hypothetical protein ACFFJT_07370 [Dyella flava]|uniref:Uncharacterized protein n=1 Tax=Dyella flava TaxID=1920170 RepID=A0ABS2K868_9GAMM|nr:hypothetical protein [Dyella flava]MBM7127410.1 hypothetical protein [Dyella flava]GLQ51008.1 hypothetical protein GCM10010872_24570 [Dyella flava]
MSHFKPNSKMSNNQVDWSDPHLESLLRKTESWKLDNRGAFSAVDVQIHVGWGANTGRKAVLVWETDQVMVLETRFTILQGEHVRVDRVYGDGVRTVWGVVAEGREGFREEDRQNGVYVHWLHVR